MSGSPELVPLADVDRAQVIELLRLALGAESLRTEDFWRWKHEDNPFGASPGLVAVDGAGRLVALRVFLRWELEQDAKVLRAVRAVDTATHPDWQRRGLFRKLTTALVEQVTGDGCDLVFNTPNDRSRPGYLKMGWREAGRLPVRVRPRRPLRMLLARGRRQADASLTPTGLLPPGDLLTPDLVGRFLAQRRADGRIRTRRGLDYLRWRYASIPAFDYGALQASTGDAAALAIFRLRTRRGARELSVSELFTTEGEQGWRLGGQICRQAAEATGADYVTALAHRADAGWRAWRRAGLLPFRLPGPTLTVRSLHSGLPDALFDVASWDVSVGDMELF